MSTLRAKLSGSDTDQTIESETITGAALRQRVLHPGDGQIVLGDMRERVEPHRRRQMNEDVQGGLAPAVSLDHAARHVEERRDAHDVVADVVVELVIAGRRRAIIDGQRFP